jgi:hypothetical protein
VESDFEVILENARSILDSLWHMASYAQDAAESLEARIEEEDLDGMTEAVEVRDTLECLQVLSLEVSEGIDAYQQRHAR